MRKTQEMEFLPKLRLTLAASLAALAITGSAAGCGGDDAGESSSPPANGTAAGSEKPSQGATGPASAGDDRGQAPDDGISDRPGGPNDKGAKNDGNGEKQPGGDGSAAPQPKPVKP